MEENKNEKQENLQTEVPKAVSPQKPKKMDKKNPWYGQHRNG